MTPTIASVCHQAKAAFTMPPKMLQIPHWSQFGERGTHRSGYRRAFFLPSSTLEWSVLGTSLSVNTAVTHNQQFAVLKSKVKPTSWLYQKNRIFQVQSYQRWNCLGQRKKHGTSVFIVTSTCDDSGLQACFSTLVCAFSQMLGLLSFSYFH